MTHDELEKENAERLKQAKRAAAKPISFSDLEKVYHKWMLIPDKGVIKFICALYIANRIPGKALWAFIIGPSGGGKTELLNPLLELSDVVPISLLTPNTFLSGMPGKGDASLLPKLSGKVALFKDWTSVLAMQKDAKSEIMSQFREIWDGSMKKVFGTGRIAEWKGKITVIAASTQAVDLNQQQYTHLGERFLNYRPIMPDRKLVAMKALDNDSNQEKMQEEMGDAMYAFMLGIDWKKHLANVPPMPQEYREEIVNLANFCTMARSGIIRDFGMKKEVIFVPASEMPTRITGQLAKLGSALTIANGGVFMKDDMQIIYKCALDSIPQTNKMVITEMAKADNQTTADIATSLGYPTEPIRMYLENLALLKVCKRIKDDGKADKWTMDPEFSAIIRNYEGVLELTEEEIKARKEANGAPAEVEGWDGFEGMGVTTP